VQLEERTSRLKTVMTRIGQTFESNLDQEALLGIIVSTSVDAVGARAGRASVRATAQEPLEQIAVQGDARGLTEAIRAAEARVLETGNPAGVRVDDVSAMAHPLRRDEQQSRVSGVVSVARRGEPFSDEDRDL